MRSGTHTLILLGLAAGIAACSTAPPHRPSPQVIPVDRDGRYALSEDAAPHPDEVPPDLNAIPDAVPRVEPRARSGNAPVYEVFGKTYRVLDSSKDFRERGMASWYGKKFHGYRTASGEIYDMYQMTAAHKSLPLPSYVRVTRLDNGRSVIVRVNDRGPFHPGRVIDLSYAAAAKLDMLDAGSAPVEIVALDPLASTPPSEHWLQVGVFEDPISAVVLRETLTDQGHPGAQILIEESERGTLHRVVLGPYTDIGTAQSLRSRLSDLGYTPSWIRP
ncbi:rare lipoprotein A [Fontimonas thermophila]|uniref:Endolytic peptidoglycan transglycosylase RlpA n=1 Tax=Fontimonas thermophila TaxID=1076937 RepID=A0A1I2IZS3_9GAMM|nr:septal ring lytic transglycosylase RlpA family protein [Fontimonas thermophila]SFF47228.1 rare lipoprotein A [Fontimonas thermophila]